jgi:predicted transcriptional regulator
MPEMPTVLPIRMPAQLREAVATAAGARLQTMSEYIRDAIRDRLKRERSAERTAA